MEEQHNKWNSVGFASLIMGIGMFLISTITGYVQIISEPSGALFQPSYGGMLLSCLVGAFAGMLAIWHYTNNVKSSLTLGKGAVIGILAGAAVVILNTVFSRFWGFVDTDFSKQLMESTIANIENMEIPDDLKQQQIDMVAQQFREMNTLSGFISQLIYGMPLYLILNALTGMLGVKVFGVKEELESEQNIDEGE